MWHDLTVREDISFDFRLPSSIVHHPSSSIHLGGRVRKREETREKDGERQRERTMEKLKERGRDIERHRET